VWYWHKDRNIDNSWNRIEVTYISGQLIFDNSVKIIQWGKRQFFRTNGVVKTGYPQAKE